MQSISGVLSALIRKKYFWYFVETYRTVIDGFPGKGDPAESRINFEQFYCLASEASWRMKNNGVSCESEIPSVWSILCRKASKFLRRAIVHPFNRFLGIFMIFSATSHSLTRISHVYLQFLSWSRRRSSLFRWFNICNSLLKKKAHIFINVPVHKLFRLD